jgi:hypothetical protein
LESCKWGWATEHASPVSPLAQFDEKFYDAERITSDILLVTPDPLWKKEGDTCKREKIKSNTHKDNTSRHGELENYKWGWAT